MKEDLQSKLLINFDEKFKSDELGGVSVEYISDPIEIDDDIYAYAQTLEHH